MVFGLDGWLIPPTHVVSAEVQHFSHVVTDAMRLGHPHVSLEVFWRAELWLSGGDRRDHGGQLSSRCLSMQYGCGWMWMKDSYCDWCNQRIGRS